MAGEPSILGPRDLSWELLDQAEELQRRIWGFPDRGPCYPARLYRVQGRIGGTPLLAVAGGRVVAFLLGLAAVDGEGPYVWSQILGVAPEWRGRGVAARLKWRQREAALESGLKRVEWTFDPLEARNSLLNLARLGAVGVAYEREVYGGAGGPRYALPSDRVRVRWELASARVAAAVAGRPPAAGVAAPAVLSAGPGPGGLLLPGAPLLGLDAAYLKVRIPDSIQDLLVRDDRAAAAAEGDRHPAAGLAWRLAVREALEHYLGRGWRLAGALAGDGGTWQVLARPEEAGR